jgi:hypothetical protein
MKEVPMKQQHWIMPRTITVASRLYEHQTYPTYRRERFVPALRLTGEWLQRMGFKEGAERGRLVLTLAE